MSERIDGSPVTVLIVANDPATRAQARAALTEPRWYVLECAFDGARATTEAFQIDAVLAIVPAPSALRAAQLREALSLVPARRIAIMASPARAEPTLRKLLAR